MSDGDLGGASWLGVFGDRGQFSCE